MPLLNKGFWHENYWVENYWNPSYWQKYGVPTYTLREQIVRAMDLRFKALTGQGNLILNGNFETGNPLTDPEKVTDGDFPSGDNWTVSGGWSISGGLAVNSGVGGGQLQQNVFAVAGHTYRISFVLGGAGSLGDLYLGGSAVGLTISGPGAKVYYLTCINSGNLIFSANAGNAFSIDGVSVKEVMVPVSWIGWNSPEVFELSIVRKYSGGYSAHIIDSTPSGAGFYQDVPFPYLGMFKLSFKYFLEYGVLNANIRVSGNIQQKLYSITGLWKRGEIPITIATLIGGEVDFINQGGVVDPAEFYIDEVTVMAYSIRQRIIDAFRDRCEAILISGGYKMNLGSNVFGWRTGKIQKSELPALVYRDRTETKEPRWGICDKMLQIEVEIYAETPEEIRQCLADVEKAVETDETWGGLALMTNFDTDEMQIQQFEDIFVASQLTLNVNYRTVFGDPYTQA